MAKLTRVTNKIFGADADPNIYGDPEISQFGSALAKTFIGTDDVATIQSLPAWGQGWIGAVTAAQQFPALSEMTGVMKVLSYQSAYDQQMGMPEWDGATTYYTNSFCQVDGTIYKSLTDDNIGNNPVEDTTNWEEFKSGGGGANNIFDIKWSDHLINDIQWLRADTFSWQSGDVYVTAYNKLVEEYDDESSVEETEGDITFKRSANGFKIATADYESAILSKYNSDGIAWYYILDTTNKRFKLPRTKWGFKGLRDNVGDDIEQDVLLPDITGNLYGMSVPGRTNSSYRTGAFKDVSSAYNTGVWSSSAANYQKDIDFDASRSSDVYSGDGTDTLIQERATQMYLYFYVGEYSQTAIEQTAGITTEQLNAKVDVSSLSEINPMITSYVNGTSGYNIWANGYCEQWGAIVATTSGVTVTFLKAFNDDNYLAIVACHNGSALSSVSADNIQTSSMKIYASNATTTWKASGYLAEGQY